MLGPAPEGAEPSKTYRAAVKAEATVLDPYKSLSAKLGRAAEAEDFVKAADDVLDNGPIVLLGAGLVFDSGPLHNRVLPELNRSLAEFRAVKVPKGAQDVAVKVDGAVTYVIGHVETMADRADEGSSYEFSYDTQYNAARQAVQRLRHQDRRRRRRGARPDQGPSADVAVLSAAHGPAPPPGSRDIGTWSMPASSKFSPERT